MQSAHANMQAPFIFKSLHPGNDSSSLHNAQDMRQTRQAHKAYEAIGSLGCSHTSFMLTQAYQSGPQPRRRTAPLILPARKTHRPLCSLGIARHCSQTLRTLKQKHGAAPFRTRCPHCIQKTLQKQQNPSPCKQPQPRASGEPFPADWRPSLCVSQIHFQSSDFVWQNWRATGPDQTEFSIEESASSACAAKHDRVTSVA